MMEEKEKFRLFSFLYPLQLPGEKVYSTYFLFSKKREVDLQLVSFNFRRSIEIIDLLKLPENRYFVYKKSPFFFWNSYSFSLKIENQEEFSLSVRKKRLTQVNSMKEHYFFKGEKNLRHGRLLYSSRSTFKFSVLGQLRNRKLGQLTKQRRKKTRVQIKNFFRPLVSLCAYGYLSNLYQVSLPFFSKKKGKLQIALAYYKKINLYLKPKNNLQFSLGLKKQKKDLFHYLTHGQEKRKFFYQKEENVKK